MQRQPKGVGQLTRGSCCDAHRLRTNMVQERGRERGSRYTETFSKHFADLG